MRIAGIRSTLAATIVGTASLTLCAQAPFDVGLAHAARGQFREAADAFQRAASSAGSEADRARSRYNRGTVLVQAGALDEGTADLEDALRLDPDNDDARINLMIAQARLARQSPPNAPGAEDLRRAVEGIPDQPLQFRNTAGRAARRVEKDW